MLTLQTKFAEIFAKEHLAFENFKDWVVWNYFTFSQATLRLLLNF